jgi:hypothetical protein
VPTIFHEKPKSRKEHVEANSRALTRNWFCMGTSDRDEVYELALLNNPSVYQGLLRKSIDLTPLFTDMWDVDAEYGIGKPTGISPDVYAFKIGTQSVHITQALETIYRLTSADPNPPVANGGKGSAADVKEAIGLTAEDVAGCDILVPKMEWSKTVQRAEITFEYLITLLNLVGKTNSTIFYGFPVGTLLYLGAEPSTSQGQLANGEEFPIWGLTHQFAYERNRLNFGISNITVPEKKGWHYLWAKYGLAVSDNRLLQPPEAVYVQRVYEAGNYELLEIGTEF